MTDPGHFDTEIASHYDLEHGGTDPSLIEATVDLLAELAAGGRALEFAIGTGRIALPLQQRGVPVQGIELSEVMVRELRRKEGGGNVPVSIGNIAELRVDGEFTLVFLVFNTICNLTTQDDQVACFRNAAAHLLPGGRFVVETFVPPLQRLPLGETRLVFDLTANHWGIDEIDVSTQRFTSHHCWLREGEIVRRSIPFRYVWPSELDLMAELADLKLESRWQDWRRTQFGPQSRSHVSVWRKES